LYINHGLLVDPVLQCGIFVLGKVIGTIVAALDIKTANTYGMLIDISFLVNTEPWGV